MYDGQVEQKQRGDTVWLVVNAPGQRLTDNKFTVSGLESDAEYEFRVSAENKAGLGQPSPVSDLVRYGKCQRLMLC
jgi:titin